MVEHPWLSRMLPGVSGAAGGFSGSVLGTLTRNLLSDCISFFLRLSSLKKAIWIRVIKVVCLFNVCLLLLYCVLRFFL